MVWLQSEDASLLSDTRIWDMIRDGRQTSDLPLPTFGFRVIKAFTTPTPLKSRFLPGMQGQVLYGHGDKVRVMVKDLFDANGDFLNDWIYRDCIEIGTEPYGTWKMDLCNVPRTRSRFTAEEIGELKNPNRQHLARGISTFLTKLAETRPECVTEETHNRLGGVSGNKVLWITNVVINGIEKAGLLSVLNDPQFTIRAIRENSNLDCKDLAAQGETGFYLRIYSKDNPGQSKKHGSVYIGQAKDLHRRCVDWGRSGQAHDDLIEESNTIEMRTICRLDMEFYQDHKYIIEQLFASLFQTYKSGLANQTVRPKGGRDNYHLRAYLEMDKVATVAASESGWTGAVQRDSFWNGSFSACEGLNYQSPISEAPMYEPGVWLESRGFRQNSNDPGTSFPISNFTSQVPKKMTVQTPGAKSASKSKSFIIFDLKTDYKSETKQGYTWRTARTLPKDFSSDGVEWPAENSFFTVTFEVRTDWKPHPFSWARLPLIGPFEDWDRANSWAMSISWVDASGQDRLKYLHCERPYMMVNEDSMGSIQPYGQGIEVIHWLFNERIASGQKHRWIQTPPMAHVKVIQNDYVRQLITLKAGKGVTTTAPIPSNRKDPQVILEEMEGKGVHGDFGLHNVGLTLGQAKKATPGKWGSRKKCDCCLFYSRGTGSSAEGFGGCFFVDGNTVCEGCRKIYGRPACSWTLGTPVNVVENTFKALASIGDTASALRRKALNGLEGSTGDSLLAPDPEMMEIDQGDDESEAEVWEGP
ncbi:hypothetical protein BKA58DRAFT_456197 [Alternaria rosae]|uniref:uncharacterized protein n=1 Tax=Alternaria rosae TaxID=1187941 RepID=UPI001E8E8B23|nr:uncharacterized protein BKA58DRAFT_456197 [Alternaria rosae]KAH6872606.1 hypothetical protein BKA58DRAFT_456197 [Alternaria rosae]